MALNHWTGHGRMTKDVFLTKTKDGLSVAKFGIAVKKKTGNNANFFNCNVFGALAENMAKWNEKGYIGKGKELVLEGEPVSNSYTNKNGEKVNTVEFVISGIDFCGSKGDGNNATQPVAQNSIFTMEKTNTPPPAPNGNFANVPYSDLGELPFG